MERKATAMILAKSAVILGLGTLVFIVGRGEVTSAAVADFDSPDKSAGIVVSLIGLALAGLAVWHLKHKK